MKALKVNHELATHILSGEVSASVRLFDDKDLSVGDTVHIIDKRDPKDRNTWAPIGTALIHEVTQKAIGDFTPLELQAYKSGVTRESFLQDMRDYYGSTVGPDVVAKMIRFTFTPTKPKLREAGLPALDIRHVKLFTDGGSRGNPGPSASGYVLLDLNDNVVKKSGIYLGITTNNQAEYQSLKLGLEEARKLGAREVDVFMDSMLVINQMKGVFKVKNRDLWPIHEAIKELVVGFKAVSFTHVPREFNKLADAEVNETLDAAASKGSV